MPVRAASVRMQELRRTMLMVPVAHRAAVGRAAARENHELGTAFRAKAARNTFQSFRVAARGMQLEAETNKEVLVKHGLSESVLEQFSRLLDELDTAVALGIEGREKHMGATAQLEGNEQELASWVAASAVLGTPRGGSPETPVPPAGEVRPAA